MYTRTTIIKNETGLHARPGARVVQKAQSFQSDVYFRKTDDPKKPNKVNAKSMVLVLMLGLVKGQTVEISASGADEKNAVDALVELINNLED